MKSWYAIYTRSRHEAEVADTYAKEDVEVFLPRLRKERRLKGRRRMMDTPLFPGYVFVHEDLRDEGCWDRRVRLLKARGVVRIVGDTEGCPTPIPDQEIANLRTVTERELKADPYRFEFYEGQPLRVRTGPLAGLEGWVVRRQGVHALVVQVTLLKQAVAVTIPAADVEAATGEREDEAGGTAPRRTRTRSKKRGA